LHDTVRARADTLRACVPDVRTALYYTWTFVLLMRKAIQGARTIDCRARRALRLRWSIVLADETCVRARWILVRTNRTPTPGFLPLKRNLAMPGQRIPRADETFATCGNHYYDAVEKFQSVQGLDNSDLKQLKEALSAWNAAYPEHVAVQNTAEAARQTKDAAKRALEG